MAQELKATSVLVDGRMRYESQIRDYPKIITDYPLPAGGDEGPTSLELFLASLCTCAGGTVSHILRRSDIKFSSLSVHAKGERRTEHPTFFKSISLEIELVSETASQKDIEKALMLAEQEICPVWNMIKNTVPVTASCILRSY